MEGDIDDLKRLAKARKAGDMPRLFVYALLTGQLLYESDDSPHNMDWYTLSKELRDRFERAASVLRGQLSLCSQCGVQAPLVGDPLVCRECESDVQPEPAFDAAHALRSYIVIMDHYVDNGYLDTEKLHALIARAREHGLCFRFDKLSGSYSLALKEEHDGS